MSGDEEQMLCMREVCVFFGGKERPVDLSTINRWIREKKLAPPVKLGPYTSRWRLSDVQQARDEMIKKSHSAKGYGP